MGDIAERVAVACGIAMAVSTTVILCGAAVCAVLQLFSVCR